MAATLFRSSTRAALRTGASARSGAAGAAGLTFARGKATLPDLSCMSCFFWFCFRVSLLLALFFDSRSLFILWLNRCCTVRYNDEKNEANCKKTTTVPWNPRSQAKSWSSTTRSTTRPMSTATMPPSSSSRRLRLRTTFPPRLLLSLPSTLTVVVT